MLEFGTGEVADNQDFYFSFSSKFSSLKANQYCSATIFKARLIGLIFPLSGIHIVSPTVKEELQTVGWDA